MKKDPLYRFLLPGVFCSAGFHVFFFLLGTPALPVLSYEKMPGRAVFLGSFLSETDVAVPAPRARRIAGQPALGPDHGRSDASPVSHLGLPKPHLVPPVSAVPWALEAAAQEKADAGADVLSFGCRDADRYVYPADFRDILKMAERAEGAAVMEMEVFVASDGQVKTIRKITGSGDPILDSYVLLKFRQAAFRQGVVPSGGRCRVIFRLK